MCLDESRTLFKKAEGLVPGGVHSPVRAFKQVGGTPVFIKKAFRSMFEDVDGNKYVDYCQSWGPLILGHARAEVVDAVRKTARDGLSYGACHKGEVELAEMILEACEGFQRVRFVNSGTEAVMTALRIARGVTGRDLVIKFEGGYHGHFDGMLVKAGSGLVTQSIASSKGVPSSISNTTLVLPYDDENSVDEVFSRYGSKIAAVIIEPLPANNGLLVQSQKFLQYLRDVTYRNGSLLIFDEVITGFRLHYGAFGQLMDITPDLYTLGKIIGGGMPVGAIVGTAKVMDNLAPVGDIYQAGTLSGNPVSLSAGKTTLEILKKESPYDKLEDLGKHFARQIDNIAIPFARTRQVGSLLWLYFDTGDFPSRADTISIVAMERFTKIYWQLMRKGHYLPPSSYEIMFLSTAHTKAEIDRLCEDIGTALQTL